jgi:hypothetical protein
MKYKICDYYGNIFQELNLEYIILSKTGISFSAEFRQICDFKDDERDEKSVELIKNVVAEVDGLFIKNEDFLIPGKLSDGELAGNVEVVWNEGKSGVNPFEYNHFYIWYTGSSSIMGFGIEKHAVNRDIEVRDGLINKILE